MAAFRQFTERDWPGLLVVMRDSVHSIYRYITYSTFLLEETKNALNALFYWENRRMAEREGFEPPVLFRYTRFPGVRFKPLSHLSDSRL